MRLAGERGQRLRRLGEIAGLVEDPAFERERLIGADAVSVRTLRADGESLRPRQLNGHTFERSATREIPIFERALVDFGRDALSVQSRRRQESAATFAPRGQNQWSRATPQRRQRCARFPHDVTRRR